MIVSKVIIVILCFQKDQQVGNIQFIINYSTIKTYENENQDNQLHKRQSLHHYRRPENPTKLWHYNSSDNKGQSIFR